MYFRHPSKGLSQASLRLWFIGFCLLLSACQSPEVLPNSVSLQDQAQPPPDASVHNPSDKSVPSDEAPIYWFAPETSAFATEFVLNHVHSEHAEILERLRAEFADEIEQGPPTPTESPTPDTKGEFHLLLLAGSEGNHLLAGSEGNHLSSPDLSSTDLNNADVNNLAQSNSSESAAASQLAQLVLFDQNQDKKYDLYKGRYQNGQFDFSGAEQPSSQNNTAYLMTVNPNGEIETMTGSLLPNAQTSSHPSTAFFSGSLSPPPPQPPHMGPSFPVEARGFYMGPIMASRAMADPRMFPFPPLPPAGVAASAAMPAPSFRRLSRFRKVRIPSDANFDPFAAQR